MLICFSKLNRARVDKHTNVVEGRNAELPEEAILRPLIKVIAQQKKKQLP